MELHAYLKKHRGAAKRIADAANTSVGYLRLIAYGVRLPSADIAIRIEQATNGAVSAESLRGKFPWEYTRQPVSRPAASPEPTHEVAA